jgi:PAS domain S-box-containing protein
MRTSTHHDDEMRMSVLATAAAPTRDALERELALSRELAATMSAAASLDAALRECLGRACDATAWELGQAWMPSRHEAETLRCRVSWASAASLGPFANASGTLKLDLRGGLPGRVWTSGSPVWIADIQASELVARRADAAAVGISSAAAVPVLAGEQPVAVLEFFTRERREHDEETIRLLTGVAGHIGPMVRLTEAQERLADSESRFRALAETAVDAIVSADRDGKIVYLNPGAQQMFGYGMREALGSPLTGLLAERDRAEHSRRFERLAMTGDAPIAGETIELTGRRADGSEFPIELSLGVHGEVGRAAFVTGIIRDTTERGHAEERLRRRETQLAEAQALAKLGSWEWDSHSGEEQWSDEVFRIYGLEPGSRTPSLMDDCLDPAEVGSSAADWRREIEASRSFSGLLRRVRPTGEAVTLHVQGRPVLDADGKLLGAAGTAQDLTEQLQVEKGRQRAEQRLRQAFENAPIGMILARADGSLSRVNEAFCTMTGYPAESLEEKQFRDLSHPDDVERSERALGELLRGERKSIHLDTRYKHAAGGWIDTRTSVSVVVDAEQQPALLIAQIQDVTATKRAERALDESRERFEAILDNAPMAVHMKDLQGRYVLVNRMAASMAGLEQEELLGKTASELSLEKAVIEAHVDGDREVIASKAPVSIERELETRDGVMTLLTNKFPVLDSDGEVYAIAGVSVDISDRVRVEDENRRLESELQEARRLEAVGGLAGGIAHDFNNLLAVIVNYAVLAREEVPDASPGADELDEIRRAAERAADLTHKLLVFSRQEQVEPQVLDLNSIVIGAEWLLRRTLGEHIELWVEPAEDLWPVEGDAAQLEGILLNLAVNAGHAMPQGGTLSIRTENVAIDRAGPAAVPPGRYVRLSVSDTGSGMAEEVAARAFDPFFTTKPTGEGTGLGLATVHGVARQAGGTVELRSRPGGGTTVTTYLPASVRELMPEPEPPAPEAPAVTGEGQAILVVEDEPSVRRMICRILARAGYSVREASPMEALEACARPDTPVDLLLTDVVMPRISGGKLAVRARELCPELKVLFMSGYVDEGKLESATYELVPLLQKPFAPAELLQSVESVLERQSARAGPG